MAIKSIRQGLFCLFFLLLGVVVAAAGADTVENAELLRKQGNFAEALTAYLAALRTEDSNSGLAGQAFSGAAFCLNRLNRVGEFDALADEAVSRYSANPRLLETVAREYMNTIHFGRLIANRFERGYGPGKTGQPLSSFARDRVTALRLYVAAMPLVERDFTASAKASFYWNFAQAVRRTDEFNSAWKLQLLTDLAALPDYDRQERHLYFRERHPAPVKADGLPVFYNLPSSFASAANDGERWRRLLHMATVNGQSVKSELLWADFLRSQFGVTSLLAQRYAAENSRKGIPEILASLSDDETVAHLASGVRRFKLPPDFNYIMIYRRLAAHQREAAQALADIYISRGQYVKAENVMKQFPAATNSDQLFQLTGNLIQFEPVGMQMDSGKPKVTFRYRNVGTVDFTATRIKVPLLLKDIKEYLRTNPVYVNWQQVDVAQIGQRIIAEKQTQYLAEKVAAWSVPLKPSADHRDCVKTVELPFSEAGAYLLQAVLPGGYRCSTVVWLTNSIIVRKNVGDKVMYYVADAASGAPLADINLDFFGYRQEPVEPPAKTVGRQTRRFNTVVKEVAGMTDSNGVYYAAAAKLPDNTNWLLEAKQQDRLVAFMGFSPLWYTPESWQQYDAVKLFCVSDRPIYRPGETLRFKVWGAKVSYDQDVNNPFAGINIPVEFYDPTGTLLKRQNCLGDRFGGFSGEFKIPGQAKLGQYNIVLSGGQGNYSFRVEEFRKPEFEVKIKMPERNVALGKSFSIEVKARYYFGEPVSGGELNYRLTRTEMSANRFPPAPWDWLFGPGYWWRGAGAGETFWWRWRPPVAETVASGMARLDNEGKFVLSVDTAEAAKLFGEKDFAYELSAGVVDSSRRQVTGSGRVIVAKQPFQVWTWTTRNFYQTGDTARVLASAIDPSGRPVAASGELQVLALTYENGKEKETEVGRYRIAAGMEEASAVKFKLEQAGKYRLVCRLSDADKQTVSNDYFFQVIGADLGAAALQFSGLELVPDKREYRPGDTMRLLINAERADSTILLFSQADQNPEIIRIKGKTAIREMKIEARNMPDFYLQAVSVADGKVLSDTCRIVVPPDKKILNLTVTPSASRISPGDTLKVKLQLTDLNSRAVPGEVAVTVYDKSLEYLAPWAIDDIRSFFWKWQRHYNDDFLTNLLTAYNLLPPGQPVMRQLGYFNRAVSATRAITFSKEAAPGGMAMAMADGVAGNDATALLPPVDFSQVTVRSKFADTAFWDGSLKTDVDGTVEISLPAPDNLTTWKIKAWAVTDKTMVGQGEAEVICSKDFLIRLEPPRFLIQGDKARILAVIHNYQSEVLNGKIEMTVQGGLKLEVPSVKEFKVAPGRETVVEWPVTALTEGAASLTMKSVAGKYSDGVIKDFPVLVRGRETQTLVNGCVVTGEKGGTAKIKFMVPEARREDDSRIVVNYSPSLAGAVVEALPYLFTYKYECTEQTLNRFLPAVIAHKTLSDLGVSLAALADRKTSLNPGDLSGGPVKTPEPGKLLAPLYSDRAADELVKTGLNRLASLQLEDGGWGWFSGQGEHSSPHITAQIVRGLLVAGQNGVYINSGMLQRGIEWLKNYQNRQMELLKNGLEHKNPAKSQVDNLDAMVFMVLCSAGHKDLRMKDYLYNGRDRLSVYGKTLLALALAEIGSKDEAAMAMRNVTQFLVTDKESGTAWLNLGDDCPWWMWYGSRIESSACYLKLLSRFGTEADLPTAAMIAKYLIVNRRHAAYWESTRDTALCVEALCEYLRRSDELNVDLKVKIRWDGKAAREVTINRNNLMTFDSSFAVYGKDVVSGEHTVELSTEGKGTLYYAAYFSCFSEAKEIPAAGKDLKVTRNYYRIIPADGEKTQYGKNGTPVKSVISRDRREKLDLSRQKINSGDVIEVELVVESKNDYEYVVIEDAKPAGLEPLEQRSGYLAGETGAYVEYRDAMVCLFVSRLAHGRHSLTYRMRAEIPGEFTALPTVAYGMYAPELKGNSALRQVDINDPQPAR